jgi:hypothetical protein
MTPLLVSCADAERNWLMQQTSTCSGWVRVRTMVEHGPRRLWDDGSTDASACSSGDVAGLGLLARSPAQGCDVGRRVLCISGCQLPIPYSAQ